MAADDLRAGRISLVAAALAGTVLGVVVLVLLWLHVRGVPPGGVPVASMPPLPASAPALESAPQPSLAEYIAQKQQRLHSRGWVDEAQGIAHIPIEEAMAMLVARAASAPAQVAAPPSPTASARAASASTTPASTSSAGTSSAGTTPANTTSATTTPAATTSSNTPSTKTPSANTVPTPARAASGPGLTPSPGAALPLDQPFTDSAGRAVTLRDYFGTRPVLLVPGYYRCPQLCGLLMHGLLESLHDSGLGAGAVRLLRVSIDPTETAADAQARRDADLAYARFLTRDGTRDDTRPVPPAAPLPPDLQALTGNAAALQALARSAGYTVRRADPRDAPADVKDPGWVHPTMVIVATPDGHIARTLPGVRFDSTELRLAVAQAAAGRTGGVIDRIALLCAQFDPRHGGHAAAVLRAVQLTTLLAVAALAAFIWRASRRRAVP